MYFCRVNNVVFLRGGGVEVVGWTVDEEIRFRFPAYTQLM